MVSMSATLHDAERQLVAALEAVRAIPPPPVEPVCTDLDRRHRSSKHVEDDIPF